MWRRRRAGKLDRRVAVDPVRAERRHTGIHVAGTGAFPGDDIDTRADIYSLGVILYELLTGLRPSTPARLRQAALTEMIRIIHEEEPSKPSTRLSTDESLPSLAALRQTEPKKLMALLRGELDWVVMKCLEKQRDRRYEPAKGSSATSSAISADEAVELGRRRRGTG